MENGFYKILIYKNIEQSLTINYDFLEKTYCLIDAPSREIIFEGTPEDLSKHPTSYTGKFLKPKLIQVSIHADSLKPSIPSR